MEKQKKKILCVGLVCLDIINVVEKYPEEDTDSRCLSQRWQRGGNASNSCTVLSLLGASCSFLGSLSAGPVAQNRRYIRIMFNRPERNIRTVCVSVSVRSMMSLGLRSSDWSVNLLQGRNADEQVKMIERVAKHNSTLPQQQRITVSVEIEKTREPLYQLFPLGDVVFVSKDVAHHFGFESAEAAVRGFYSRVKPGAVLVCAWAEKGADALGPDDVVIHSDSFPPETLVDTLGAGDTFNAAVIFTLSNGGSLQDALTFGCRVAGRKCGFHGYDGIGEHFKDEENLKALN